MPTQRSVISLHRLSPRREPFHLNPDLIATVEACPDTVVSLTTGSRVVVIETPAAVVDSIRAWRAGILADALSGRLEGVGA
jgi:flagellar protein FlbD